MNNVFTVKTNWLHFGIAFSLICLVSLASRSGAQDFESYAKTSPQTYYYLFGVSGEAPRFTAESRAIIKRTNGAVIMDYVCKVAATKGMFRREMGTYSFKVPFVADEIVAAGKRIGLSTNVSILRIDQMRIYDVFPGANLYHSKAISTEVINTLEQNAKETKIEKVSDEDEMVNGYACKKYRVLRKTSNGVQEDLAWLAPSLNNFPVKIQVLDNGEYIIQEYNNISTNEPSALLFEVPSGSVEKADIKEVMQNAKENWMNRLIEKAKQKTTP